MYKIFESVKHIKQTYVLTQLETYYILVYKSNGRVKIFVLYIHIIKCTTHTHTHTEWMRMTLNLPFIIIIIILPRLWVVGRSTVSVSGTRLTCVKIFLNESVREILMPVTRPHFIIIVCYDFTLLYRRGSRKNSSRVWCLMKFQCLIFSWF